MKFGSKTHYVQARKLFMVKVQALSIKVSQGAQGRKALHRKQLAGILVHWHSRLMQGWSSFEE